MDDAVKTRLDGNDLDTTVTNFYNSNKNWEHQHAILSATLQIAIDSQFGVKEIPVVAPGKALDCTH